MVLKDQNILFFTRTMKLGGTENVILQLCEIFKPLVNKIVVCSCGGVNEKELDKLNIKHYVIPDIEEKKLIVFINTIKAIKKIVSDEKITVIHTHHRMAAFYVKLLALNKHCYFINTSHNTFENKKILTRYAYKGCHLVACGEMVKDNLQRYFNLNDVTVIHNSVKPFTGPVSFISDFQEEKGKGQLLIGNIGRLSKQKGMEYYIKAIPKVLSKVNNVQFYIIGEGEDEDKLKHMCMEEGVHVSFLGYRKDIQNIMAQLDLIVLSSLWEGLPLTPIEAFSVGKTIVATDVDGNAEIVKDGYNGYLVEARNPDALAAKIIELCSNNETRCYFESQAALTYSNEFSFERFKNCYINYYESL